MLRVILPALGLFGLGVGSVWSWQTQGVGAPLLLLALIGLCLVLMLVANFRQEQRVPEQLLRALANGDCTLGLNADHPLKRLFEEARQRILDARGEAGEQAQFLRQVLLHTDLALLICDSDGKVLEQSPAATRLLGLKCQSLAGLGELGMHMERVGRSTLPWQGAGRQDTLSLQVSEAQISGRLIRLVTLQSIHDPLNQREQQAYSRLTRVLTHEVANSITPLASLADTCHELLPAGLCFETDDDRTDLGLALKTLSSRTHHLGQFIQEFRKVAAIPKPVLLSSSFPELLANVRPLLETQCREAGVTLMCDVSDGRILMLDASQIEQVLINLVKNAIEAIKLASIKDGCIEICSHHQSDSMLILDVVDNGPGVTPEAAEMMFVPFFTTKRQGSGIGLALARQIMVNHGGDLVLVNQPVGACLRLRFG
ncbi:histidine kinase [Shewanella cyperi]|uniref:histidine kinase n=1 Tax=Shewanella cyperi TaxID=2814292 RepID=A0A974XKZ9_9GAMM|nr:ATP-binding protein [Shewanella cyperi]QSX30352.1 histidine kinase [Shewanella cyperi]